MQKRVVATAAGRVGAELITAAAVSAADLVGPVFFFTSPDAALITDQTPDVDEGRLMT